MGFPCSSQLGLSLPYFHSLAHNLIIYIIPHLFVGLQIAQ